MTLQQGIKIAQMAKAKGYAIRAESGRVQFVTVEYDESGASTVTPRTDWLTYEGALEAIENDGE